MSDVTSEGHPQYATRRTAEGAFIETVPRPPLAVTLGLEPHPEGGWYRRTWASPTELRLGDDPDDVRVRPAATIILFLLPAGEFSAWHRVTSPEIWIWNGLGPVGLQLGGSGPTPEDPHTIVVGGDVSSGQVLHGHVPADVWQRTLPGEGDALVSCVVSPGFDFADFSLEPGA
ncbi:MAG: cupin domain-containing protein [Glaciihabitans sp.]